MKAVTSLPCVKSSSAFSLILELNFSPWDHHDLAPGQESFPSGPGVTSCLSRQPSCPGGTLARRPVCSAYQCLKIRQTSACNYMKEAKSFGNYLHKIDGFCVCLTCILLFLTCRNFWKLWPWVIYLKRKIKFNQLFERKKKNLYFLSNFYYQIQILLISYNRFIWWCLVEPYVCLKCNLIFHWLTP